MAHDVTLSGRMSRMFRRDLLPPSSESTLAIRIHGVTHQKAAFGFIECILAHIHLLHENQTSENEKEQKHFCSRFQLSTAMYVVEVFALL